MVLLLRSDDAVRAADHIEFSLGSVPAANAVRYAIITVSGNSETGRAAFRKLVSSIALNDCYSNSDRSGVVWAYLEYEVNRHKEGSLRSGAMMGAAVWQVREEFDDLATFVTQVQRDWPELRGYNSLNALLIQAYFKLGRLADVTRVFEDQVITAPNSRMKPPGSEPVFLQREVAPAYQRLGRQVEFNQLIHRVLQDHPESALAHEIKGYLAHADKRDDGR